jgi:hypothetical protein
MNEQIQQLRSKGYTDEQILMALSRDLATNPVWIARYGRAKVSRCLEYVEFLLESLQSVQAA